MKILYAGLHVLVLTFFSSFAVNNVLVHNNTRQHQIEVTYTLKDGETGIKRVSPDILHQTALIARATSVRELHYRVDGSPATFTHTDIPTSINKRYPDAFRKGYVHQPGADKDTPYKYDAILYIDSASKPAEWTIGEK